ncbi:MAG: MATE family efflux transporter [Acidobacteriota bacterium]
MLPDVRAMLTLAWPVVLAELGWVLMGIIDTVFVGPLGPAAIGAVGTGSSMFIAVMVLGIGTLFALDTFVSQAFGAGRTDDCHRWLIAGLWLAVVMSVLLGGIGVGAIALLPRAGIHPDVLRLLQPYLWTLLWSAPPLLVYTVLRRYLQAMNLVRPIVVAVILANVVNALGNWLFVYGHWGVPALGTVGAAYATLMARICLMVSLAVVILRREHGRRGLFDVPIRPDAGRIWQLMRLGVPAALQITLEVGVFTTAAALAARISPVALAANQIVLGIASFVFMVPYGLSSAAAIRVGQAIGRGDLPGARLAGWSAIALTLAASLAMAVILVGARWPLLRLFSQDASVLSVGATLLLLCAAFQPFDGCQAVATGALRGIGDTRTPMLCNLAGHWFVGLPLGYVLCFNRGWGVIGLWTGLSLSLTIIGAALVLAWHWRTGRTVRAQGWT